MYITDASRTGCEIQLIFYLFHLIEHFQHGISIFNQNYYNRLLNIKLL